MPRKNHYYGGIVGADPVVSSAPRTSGVFSLGAVGGDGAATTRPARRWGGMTGRSLTNDVARPAVIDHSLRFDGSADYLLTDAVSASNRQTFTISAWIKLSDDPSADAAILASGYVAGSYNYQVALTVSTNNELFFFEFNSGWVAQYKTQNTLNVGSWYHVVCQVDTTATPKCKMWIDGTLQTLQTVTYDYGASSNTLMSVGTWPGTSTAQKFTVGGLYYAGSGNLGYKFPGQLAEVHFIDGTAYDETYFGETRDGQWVPKEVTGVTYGANGFHLDFADNSTTAALGNDVSGNSPPNNHVVNNMTTDDQLIDTPNLRFATWDPAFSTSVARTLSEGNLWLTSNLSNFSPTGSTQPVSSGKYYAEFVAGDSNLRNAFGVCEGNYSFASGDRSYTGSLNNVGMFATDGRIFANGGQQATPSFSGVTYNSTVIGVTLDLDSSTKTVKWYLDGQLHHTYNLSSPSSMRFCVGDISGSYTAIFKANFGADHTFAGTLAPLTSPYSDDDGNGEFYYQPPAGFKALATKIVGSDAVLQSTGVLSLAEHYQAKL